jgi:hypothetical protein
VVCLVGFGRQGIVARSSFLWYKIHTGSHAGSNGRSPVSLYATALFGVVIS